MRTLFISAAAGITATVAFLAFAPAETMRAVDGDTLRIGAERVRLIGFDAPETFESHCDEEYALGIRARDRLADLIRDPSARLVRTGAVDKYRRSLARLDVAGRDVADIMVGEGLAARYSGHTRRQDWCAVLRGQK